MNVEYSPLAHSIERAVSEFLDTAGSDQICNFYDKVLFEVDGAVLRATMEYCEGNQSKATNVLGMSRATLRKKLAEHELLYYGKPSYSEIDSPPIGSVLEFKHRQVLL